MKNETCKLLLKPNGYSPLPIDLKKTPKCQDTQREWIQPSNLIINVLFSFNKENLTFSTRTLWWPIPKSLPGPGICWWWNVSSPKEFWEGLLVAWENCIMELKHGWMPHKVPQTLCLGPWSAAPKGRSEQVCQPGPVAPRSMNYAEKFQPAQSRLLYS